MSDTDNIDNGAPDSPEGPENGNGNGNEGRAEILFGLMGGAARGIHEMGVNGSVIEQTRDLVENYMRPDIAVIEEPTTGEKLTVAIDHNGGVTPIDDMFDAVRARPRFRRGSASMLSLDSFIDHVNRFGDTDSAVFADNNRSAPSLTAVLDYHRTGAGGETRHGKHRTLFAFPLSDEWKAWTANNGDAMKMTEFAHFLEDRIIDVMPSNLINLSDEARLFVDTLGGTGKIAEPAKLMELATGLQIFENSTVKEANRLASGEVSVEFQSEHLDGQGQKLNIPSMFVLGIPVFKNGPVYQIIARLRYRKNGPQIVFFYELWRTDRVFDHAFDEAVARVEEQTDAQVFLGKVEINA